MMKVWIDHDLCMGAGTCETAAPAVFAMAGDGLAYVKDSGRVIEKRGADGFANVPPELEDAVIDAAEGCPGECIVIEVDPR